MRNSVVQNIQKAKESHLSQLRFIELLIKGVELDEKKIYRSQYECIFGKWLFGEGQQLKDHLDMTLIDEIEKLHALWHEEYLKIYEIYFANKTGFFTKFLGKEREISQMDRDKAKLYLNDLEGTTEQLIKKLDTIIRKVGALGITNLN
jgi:hypothetical protein